MLWAPVFPNLMHVQKRYDWYQVQNKYHTLLSLKLTLLLLLYLKLVKTSTSVQTEPNVLWTKSSIQQSPIQFISVLLKLERAVQ